MASCVVDCSMRANWVDVPEPGGILPAPSVLIGSLSSSLIFFTAESTSDCLFRFFSPSPCLEVRLEAVIIQMQRSGHVYIPELHAVVRCESVYPVKKSCLDCKLIDERSDAVPM